MGGRNRNVAAEEQLPAWCAEGDGTSDATAMIFGEVVPGIARALGRTVARTTE